MPETRGPAGDDSYDVNELIAQRGKRGRPTPGSGPASVESTRLDPEVREAVATRAKAAGTSTSQVIRQALREYLDV